MRYLNPPPIPLKNDMKNTQYKDAIIQQLASVPFGKVCSYGQLAKLAGLPGYARQVGSLLKKLPKDTLLPWHRIVNSKGEISFPLNSPAFTEQKKRLACEGIEVLKGKVHKHWFI